MATIDQRGNSWRVQIRTKGQPVVCRSFSSLEAARAWAAETEGVPTFTTLASALEHYRATVSPSKKGGRIEAYRIGKLLREHISSLSLTSIRPKDIAIWRDEHSHMSPNTIKAFICIISQVYKTAKTEWGMDQLINPTTGVRRPRSLPGRNRILFQEEEARLLSHCAHIQSVVLWAIETGMRRGELLAVTRDQIRGRSIQLGDTKTGKPRSVPLSKRAYEILQSLPKEGRLFPISKHSVNDRWKIACRKAGIADLRFHDLRHTAVTRMLNKHLSVLEVMSITGHTAEAMLARYSHFVVDDLAAKLDGVGWGETASRKDQAAQVVSPQSPTNEPI